MKQEKASVLNDFNKLNPMSVKVGDVWDVPSIGGRLKVLEVNIEDALVEFSNGTKACVWLPLFKGYDRLHVAGDWRTE
jgi:hypothetical protein